MAAYCLFETYGFPLEFAVDEMERCGMTVDEKGFHVLESMARQWNKNTFKGNPTAKLALVLCIALEKKFEDIFYF